MTQRTLTQDNKTQLLADIAAELELSTQLKDINEQRAAEAEAAAAEIEDCAEEIADEMAADAAPVEA